MDLNETLGRFLDAVAAEIVGRIQQRIQVNTPPHPTQRVTHAAHPLAGRKLDMKCRWPRCRSVSKGPRFGFMCAEHVAEPEAAKKKARAAYRLRHLEQTSQG